MHDLAAELDEIERAQVPEIVSSVFTVDEWRLVLTIKAVAWYMPVGEENVERHDELVARFADAVTPATVAMIEQKLDAGENLDFAEGHVWSAAVRRSESKLPPLEQIILREGEPEPPPSEAERVWDEWYSTPISESLFGPRQTWVTTGRATCRHLRVLRSRPRAPRRHRRAARSLAARGSPREADADPPLGRRADRGVAEAVA